MSFCRFRSILFVACMFSFDFSTGLSVRVPVGCSSLQVPPCVEVIEVIARTSALLFVLDLTHRAEIISNAVKRVCRFFRGGGKDRKS